MTSSFIVDCRLLTAKRKLGQKKPMKTHFFHYISVEESLSIHRPSNKYLEFHRIVKCFTNSQNITFLWIIPYPSFIFLC